MPSLHLTRENRVASGSYPLYRLCVLGLVASGTLQLVSRQVPGSLDHTSPGWFDVVYIIMQLGGSVMILTALTVNMRPTTTMQMERVGVLLVGTSTTCYIAAVIFYTQDHIPIGLGSWLCTALTVYSVYRVREIGRILRLAECQ